MDSCMLCGITLIGKPTVVTEGLLCGDGMGCRRRALADAQCQSRMGNLRCERRALHVLAMEEDGETPDRNERRHLAHSTTWNDSVPVRKP